MVDIPWPGFFTPAQFASGGWVVVLATVVYIVIVVVTLFTIGHNRRPTTAVAWLLAIVLIPYLGIALFFVFGTNRLPKRRRMKQAEADDIIRAMTDEIEDDGILAPVPDRYQPISRLVRELTAIPALPNNRITLHGDYDPTILRMAEEVDRADSYVHVMFYALALDDVTEPFFQAMERAVERGVTVRVLYDQLGSNKYSGYRAMRRRLTASGVHWKPALSVWPWEGGVQRPDLRNHRKLLVIDGRTAWTGSQNMIERGYHKPDRPGRRLWQDLMARIDGPMAIGVDVTFITDWYAETGELIDDGAIARTQATVTSAREISRLRTATEDGVRAAESEHDQGPFFDCQFVPSGPGYEYENNLRLFTQLLYMARERIVIVSPYFAPDDSMLYAITTAAIRGVSVELHVSAKGDQLFVQHAQQSYYETLLRAGVRIWLYREPYVLHAKHITVDDEVTLVGSSNMDMRSFTLNSELMLIVYGREFAEQMHVIEQDYRAVSEELTLGTWLHRPRLAAAFDDFARLTSMLQ